VPFTLVHAGKYRTEAQSKTDTLQKLNTTQKKQATQNRYTTTLVQLSQPGNEVGLFYNAPEPTQAHDTSIKFTDL